MKYLILLPLFLTACSQQPVKIETKIVEVPKLYCPEPPLIEKPNLAINTISESDDIGDIAVKYKASIKALQLYSQSLERALKLYEHK